MDQNRDGIICEEDLAAIYQQVGKEEEQTLTPSLPISYLTLISFSNQIQTVLKNVFKLSHQINISFVKLTNDAFGLNEFWMLR